jgi:hypothetical protein
MLLIAAIRSREMVFLGQIFPARTKKSHQVGLKHRFICYGIGGANHLAEQNIPPLVVYENVL